jgi:hypothetical protein
MTTATLLKDDQLQLKFWVITSKGKFGPYDSQFIAESASHSLPKNEGELPQIVPLTVSGQQVLFG